MLLSVRSKYLYRVVPPVAALILCLFAYYKSREYADPPVLQEPGKIRALPPKPNPCKQWIERGVRKQDIKQNTTKQWWEWNYACKIEAEWDRGIEYRCKDLRNMGNYKICFDQPYGPKPPCLVYSFGIDNDFTFDDAMAKFGCEVYSFDPSMGVESHQRSERVHFLNLGIATEDSDTFSPVEDVYTRGKSQKWKIRTLASIKKMLGHEKRNLDILKLDVESYEWKIVKQIIEDGTLNSVKLLAIEWHIFIDMPTRAEFPEMLKTTRKVKDAGFRQYYAYPDDRRHHTSYFNSQVDNALINDKFQSVSEIRGWYNYTSQTS